MSAQSLTIGQFITQNAIAGMRERIAKLQQMQAPAVMVDALVKQLAEAERTGSLKIGGDSALLEKEYVGGEWKKGRGGKAYLAFSNGVNYFPQARFGRFISVATES